MKKTECEIISIEVGFTCPNCQNLVEVDVDEHDVGSEAQVTCRECEEDCLIDVPEV